MELSCDRLREVRGKWNCTLGKGGCLSEVAVPPIGSLLCGAAQKDERQTLISEVREAIGRHRATMVLGAGVSIPAGMPDWRRLISRMAGSAMQYRDHANKGPDPAYPRMRCLAGDLIAGRLGFLGNVNVLEAGQYIHQELNFDGGEAGNELMKQVISSIVDESTPPEEFLKAHLAEYPALDPRGGDDAAQRVAAGRNTLCAVSYLLKKDFRRALTYNYDTLVQECLISVFGVPEGKIVTHPGRWGDQIDPGSIEIFHVHGCIPRTGMQDKPPAFPKESDNLILSEDSYYNIERYEAYNWQNSVQSYYLNRDSCLFVGFSADDYNFRRILRQLGSSNDGRRKHYIIFTINAVVREIWESVCRCHLGENVTPEELRNDALILLERELNMKSDYWRFHGICPIWATHDDVPDILVSLA